MAKKYTAKDFYGYHLNFWSARDITMEYYWFVIIKTGCTWTRNLFLDKAAVKPLRNSYGFSWVKSFG